MKYQLVLQLPAHSAGDFDRLVALEDQIAKKLGNSHDVDGHDVGSGTMNIFIITKQPVQAFEISKAIFRKKGLLDDLKAAYREENGEEYKVVWPANYPHKFQLISPLEARRKGPTAIQLIKAIKSGVKSAESEPNPDPEVIEGLHSVITALEKDLRKQKTLNARKKRRKST